MWCRFACLRLVKLYNKPSNANPHDINIKAHDIVLIFLSKYFNHNFKTNSDLSASTYIIGKIKATIAIARDEEKDAVKPQRQNGQDRKLPHASVGPQQGGLEIYFLLVVGIFVKLESEVGENEYQ